jgi:hypothetical protein
MGHYRGPIDGIYGALTQQAVKAFQKQAQLSPSGIFDNATWNQLNEATPATINPAASTAPGNAAVPDQPSGQSAVSEAAVAAEPLVEEAPSDAAAPSSSARGGIGWLWPVLALMAALGSFGIGFILANRGKAGSDAKTEEDAVWGVVPEPDRNEAMGGGLPSPRGSNGYTSAPLVSSPAGAAVSETTRLARVNIVDELIGELQTVDSVTRRKAIWELGQRGNSTAVQPLVNLMVDADSKEKSLILAALSEIGIRALKPMNRALAIALQDENPEVRKNGIRDLTRIYGLVSQISQMLVHATEDEDAEVRQTATWALEQLNRIRQLPEVKSSLQSLEVSRTGADHLMQGEVSR